MKHVLAVLAAAIPCAIGCVGGVEVQKTFFSEKRFDPRPAEHPIEFFLKAPTRPYVVVGNIRAREDGNYEYPAGGQKSVDQIKAVVRQMGGDAVIDFDMSSVMLVGNMGPPVRQGNMIVTTYSVNEGDMTLQGTVIRWE